MVQFSLKAFYNDLNWFKIHNLYNSAEVDPIRKDNAHRVCFPKCLCLTTTTTTTTTTTARNIAILKTIPVNYCSR